MRKFRIIILTVLGLLLLCGVTSIIFNPRLQIEFFVHQTVRNPEGYATRAVYRLLTPYLEGAKPIPPSMAAGFVEMLSDQNRDVREIALFLMMRACNDSPENRTKFFNVPGIEGKLRKLINDKDSNLTGQALIFWGSMKKKQNIPYFREILKSRSSDGSACIGAVYALADTDDPQVLNEILPFVYDSRLNVAETALAAISEYDDQRVLDAIADMLPSTVHSSDAKYALSHFRKKFPAHDISAQMDPALLAASRNDEILSRERTELPPYIQNREMKIQAWENILLDPGARDRGDPASCQLVALAGLSQMSPSASSAIPSLEKITHDPATDPKVRDVAELLLKKLRP